MRGIKYLSFERITIAILFVTLCLATEIEFLNDIWNKRQSAADFDLIGIAVDSVQNLSVLRRYKKAKQINFSIFSDRNKTIMRWTPQNNFPLVLFVGPDRKIIKTHLPVTDDHLLVEKNYKALERFLSF